MLHVLAVQTDTSSAICGRTSAHHKRSVMSAWRRRATLGRRSGSTLSGTRSCWRRSRTSSRLCARASDPQQPSSSQAALCRSRHGADLLLIPHIGVGGQGMFRHTPLQLHTCSARCRAHWLSKPLQARPQAPHPRAPRTSASRGHSGRRPGSPAWVEKTSAPSTRYSTHTHSTMCTAATCALSTGRQHLHALSTATQVQHALQCAHVRANKCCRTATWPLHSSIISLTCPALHMNYVRRVVLTRDIQ